jgi:nucleoid-associated protein YgaU
VAGPLDTATVAHQVIAGDWGNGQDRKDRLAAAGYDYDTVQALVNEILSGNSAVHRAYVVQPGDSLSGIADRLGIAGGWEALWNANKALIEDPNLIYAGQVLVLP